jgi:glycosyltransferase involved in cell wall biosynthesis
MLKLLWIIEFDYAQRLHHGGYLRYFNLAPELLRLGHQVRFFVRFQGPDAGQSRLHFQKLKADGIFTDFVESPPVIDARRSFLHKLSLHPATAQSAFECAEAGTVEAIRNLIQAGDVNALVISTRTFFPLLISLKGMAPVCLDYCDAETLAYARALRLEAREFRPHRWFRALRDLQYVAMQERYFGIRGDLNLFVTENDRRCIERLSGGRSKGIVVGNGVRIPEKHGAAKVPKRLIFSGVMTFPPNVAAARWFVGKVLPLIVPKHPDVQFVIAGADPAPEVLVLASKNVMVTGFVEDLYAEIAKSSIYVAPIVSGTGFRNKVVEALVNGTYVVSTPFGVEFLSAEIRELLEIAEQPAAMAERVSWLLSHPDAVGDRMNKLQPIVEEQFHWSGRARELSEALERMGRYTRVEPAIG